jgi:ribosomal protein S20
MSKKITEAVEAEKAAIIEMLTGMQASIDIALRNTIVKDNETLRFASGFVGGIIESIEDNLHRGEAPQPKSSIILP